MRLEQWWRSRGGLSLRIALTGVFAAVTAGMVVAQATRGAQAEQSTDAVAFQAAGRIIGAHGCIYCLNTEGRVQLVVLGALEANGVKPFDNPPLVAWLVQPFSGVDVHTYTLLSVLLVVLALVAALVIAVRVIGASWPGMSAGVWALALVAPLPGLEALLFAQWDGLMLAALVGAYALVRTKHLLAAGVALSFLLIKPQDVWLVPIVLIVVRAWPTLRGFLLGAAGWVISSLMVVNVSTLLHFTDSLNQNRFETQFTVGLPGIAAAVLGPGAGFGVAACGLGVVIAIAWLLRVRLRRDLLLALDLGIVISLLFSPHVFSHDLLLLGAVLLDLGRRNLDVALGAAAVLDLFYLLEMPLTHTRGHLQAAAITVVGVIVVLVISGKAGRRPTLMSRPDALA